MRARDWFDKRRPLIRVVKAMTGLTRLWLVGALLAGIALRLDAVDSGLRGDDYVQLAMVEGTFPAPRASWDLFRFVGPRTVDRQALGDFGYLPWWKSDELSLAMLRPLPSLLMYIDYSAFPDRAVLHHIHSLAWWCLLSMAAACLFFRWLPGPAATVAILFFCLDDTHILPVSWLANRSALMAMTFGCLALYCQDRHLETRTWPWLAGMGTLLALTLGCGEYGLATLGYSLPTAWFATRSPQARKFQLWALGLPTVGYLSIRAWLEFGVAGSAFYLSPLSTPLSFLEECPLRLGLLTSDLWLGLPAQWGTGWHPLRMPIVHWLGNRPDLYRLVPSAKWTLGITGLCLFVGLCLWSIQRLRATYGASLPGRLVLGSCLALLPMTGSLPESRLLGAGALGEAAALGLLVIHMWKLRAPRPWLSTSLIVSMVAVHCGLAGARSAQGTASLARLADRERSIARQAELPIRDAESTRVFVTAAPDFLTAANLPFVRLAQGWPLPRSYQRLSGAAAPMALRRVGDRELELTVRIGNVANSMAGTLYRPQDRPVHAGQRFSLPGLNIKVLKALRGNAQQTLLTFECSLDDPSVWLVHAYGGQLRKLAPPKLGESINLKAPSYRQTAR